MDSQKVLQDLLREILFGPPGDWAFVLNPGSPGLLAVLEPVAYSQAVKVPPGCNASIAAHTNHLLYSLDLIHQWAEGDPNPFATADWGRSWTVDGLDEQEWSQIKARLRDRSGYWLEFLSKPREWDPISLSGATASLPHIAYHFGAIKQLLKVS